MKSKVIILFVVFSFVSMSMFAQRGKSDKNRTDRMKSAMVGRISNQLKLTSDEAEKFWPVYNEMQTKKQELRKSMMDEMTAIRKSKKEGQSFTDADYQKMLSLSLNHKVKDAELRKTYFEKFGKILSAEKVLKLERINMQPKRAGMRAGHIAGQARHKGVFQRHMGSQAKGKFAPRFGMQEGKKPDGFHKNMEKGKKPGRFGAKPKTSEDKKE